MLTAEKNKYFHAVKRRKLDPRTFAVGTPETVRKLNARHGSGNPWTPALRIAHESGLVFEIYEGGSPGYPERRDFKCFYNSYIPSMLCVSSEHNSNETGPCTSEQAVRIFDSWLEKQIIKFNDHRLAFQRVNVEDADIPDLWRLATDAAHDAEIRLSRTLLPSEIELAEALQQIRTFIRKTYSPTSEQQEAISRNLDNLQAELQRRPLTDWRGVIIGTLINIVVALYLSNEQGKQLIDFARRAFEACLRVLP